MHIKRGKFDTQLSEKTKMRKVRKKYRLGESLNWNRTIKRKTLEDLRLKKKAYKLIAHVVLTAPRDLLYISFEFKKECFLWKEWKFVVGPHGRWF